MVDPVIPLAGRSLRFAVGTFTDMVHTRDAASCAPDMYAGQQVALLQETSLPLALVEGTPLTRAHKIVGGIYRALADIGHPPNSAEESGTSRMPTREEAETLSLGLGSPCSIGSRAVANWRARPDADAGR